MGEHIPLGMPDSPIGNVCSFRVRLPVKPDMFSLGGCGTCHPAPFEDLDQWFSIVALALTEATISTLGLWLHLSAVGSSHWDL